MQNVEHRYKARALNWYVGGSGSLFSVSRAPAGYEFDVSEVMCPAHYAALPPRPRATLN